MDLKEMEQEIEQIKQRNKKVELDKSGKHHIQEKYVFVY